MIVLKPCSVDGCDAPLKARGMCGTHYALWRRNGKPERISPIVKYPDTCSVDGCIGKHSAKGFCSMHYSRWRSHASTDDPRKAMEKPRCSVDGCGDRKIKGHGLCAYHYERRRRGLALENIPERITRREKCSIGGCGKKHSARGFCAKHYQRWRSHGDPHHEKSNIPYGSGKDWHLDKVGYVKRNARNRVIYQHREVMEAIIGRALLSSETVHHVNGDKSDNRPENLELWSRSQPAGQRLIDRVEWAADFLTGDVMLAAVTIKPEIAVSLRSLATRIKLLYG